MDMLLSDLDSFSESSSSEDLDDVGSLFGGQARSIFSNLEETIENIDDFLLFERGFTHGEVVCSVFDPLGQTGKVIDIDVTVDLETICGNKIQNVRSQFLQKIRPLSVGDYVVLGSWLGKVDKVVDRLTVLFEDGTKCQLSAAGPETIVAISPHLIEDPQYPFYPGQRVQVESASVSQWLCGLRNDKQEIGTVCNVEAELVYVDWLSCAVIGDWKGFAPPCLQDAKNLSMLSSGLHSNWQLGDWCILPTALSPNFQQIGVISKIKSKVDVQWQDGSQSVGLDSHLLFPVNVFDVHDFWPDTFVMEKGTVDDSQVPGSLRWGIVRCVDAKERTVSVRWFNSSLHLHSSEEKWVEEIVSAYELIEHPDYSYCVGEAVFGIDKSISNPEDGSCVGSHTTSKISVEEEAGLVEHGGDLVEPLNKNFLSQIGVVISSKDGYIEVTWANGATSKVAPYEIYRPDKWEGSSASYVAGDENSQRPKEEFPAKENELFGQNDAVPLDHDKLKAISCSFPQLALDFFTRISSSLFGSHSSPMTPHRCTSAYGKTLSEPPREEAWELCSLTLDADHLEVPEKKIDADQNYEANEHILQPAVSNHPDSFRQFDTVDGCSDHHFNGSSGMVMHSPQVKKGWLKKVQQEWSILERDLPESIYVRACEERMDLLRAAIVGSHGTPYHDCLFFFDIHLPPDYPNQPPMVYYNSGGLRVNPNLYESGKVCLSLLNTWTGSNTEVWNPKSSTILQLLLSLQALVLNEKPYFNEAGYDTQMGKAEGEKSSVSYNENAFLVSCRSMLYLLRRTPKHFEALVDEHLRRRGRQILLACRAYMGGAPVGHPFSCEHGNQAPSSKGFKIMLGKLIPRLVEAFSDKGVDCSDFVPMA